MQVKNAGTSGVDLPTVNGGISVKAGEVIDVPADVGAALVAQGWTRPAKPKAKKSTAPAVPVTAETKGP